MRQLEVVGVDDKRCAIFTLFHTDGVEGEGDGL